MGGLTTHVLDTALGRPGSGINLRLQKPGSPPTLICATVTNEDGRTDHPLLNSETFTPGTYELIFEVAEYFRQQHHNPPEPPFLNEVTLRFTLSDDTHYHVPLLVSPWSYSTYRGS